MPYYEWTRSDPFRDHANDRTVIEGEVVELPESIGESAYGFVEADAPENAGDGGGETQASDADASESTSADGAADTPLTEKHWRTAVSEVEDGEYDGRLDELAENDDLTDSVREAVEERQAALAE
jgi:hypothetical protein